MCGITGAIWTDPQLAIDAALVRKMTEALRHRGPDDQGEYRHEFQIRPPYEAMPGVALGFRRLSIIDLATGQQPMTNEDGSVRIVFNGEIYNYDYLRRRLEGSGHKFHTDSDTETIVHLYEDEGPNCFAHLNGMFAVAIWDARRRRLVLGRDRLGKKPLVYRHDPGRLLFASELKSLLAVPGLPREIDPAAIDEYLTYQYIPHPNTIFRGLQKAAAGALGGVARRQTGGEALLDARLWQRTAHRGRRKRSTSCGDSSKTRSRFASAATCRWERFSPAASIRRSSWP